MSNSIVTPELKNILSRRLSKSEENENAWENEPTPSIADAVHPTGSPRSPMLESPKPLIPKDVKDPEAEDAYDPEMGELVPEEQHESPSVKTETINETTSNVAVPSNGNADQEESRFSADDNSSAYPDSPSSIDVNRQGPETAQDKVIVSPRFGSSNLSTPRGDCHSPRINKWSEKAKDYRTSVSTRPSSMDDANAPAQRGQSPTNGSSDSASSETKRRLSFPGMHTRAEHTKGKHGNKGKGKAGGKEENKTGGEKGRVEGKGMANGSTSPSKGKKEDRNHGAGTPNGSFSDVASPTKKCPTPANKSSSSIALLRVSQEAQLEKENEKARTSKDIAAGYVDKYGDVFYDCPDTDGSDDSWKGWSIVVNESRMFYYHESKNIVQWVCPEDLYPLLGEWKAVRTGSGNATFWHNSVAHISLWSDPNVMTDAFEAALSGNSWFLQLFHQFGGSFRVTHPENGATVLHYAMSGGSAACTYFILQTIPSGAINDVDDSGYSALDYGVRYGYWNLCQLLVDARCSTEVARKALDLAKEMGASHCQQILEPVLQRRVSFADENVVPAATTPISRGSGVSACDDVDTQQIGEESSQEEQESSARCASAVQEEGKLSRGFRNVINLFNHGVSA